MSFKVQFHKAGKCLGICGCHRTVMLQKHQIGVSEALNQYCYLYFHRVVYMILPPPLVFPVLSAKNNVGN